MSQSEHNDLNGNHISLLTRVGAVADVFDALTHERASQKARTAKKALKRPINWLIASRFLKWSEHLSMHCPI